jgi:sec-independent protein translocase protein TatA
MPIGSRLPELILLLVIALLIFGPKKLPEIGASIGKSINSFKKGMREIEDTDKEKVQTQPTDQGKEEIQEQILLEQKRSELDALERELAAKKAAASAYEASQAKHAEIGSTDLEQD